ncbi:MAG TPA: CPBP family glutamic-type intramembrane protease [Burkholderiales bacterium]|nr:CPBP family glutamic-type intramembrane protease [Burkholderiales bacterium]
MNPSASAGYALISMAIACVLGLCPAAARAQPSPALAGIASAIVPGLGQASNGDYAEAAAHFGIFALSLSTGLYYERKPDFLSDDVRYDDANNRESINQTTLRRDFALRLATDTALYSSFGAYRDARARDDRAYRTPAPKESLSDLALAPFSWQFLSRPTTFLPLALQAWAVSRSKDAYGIYRGHDVSAGDLQVYNATANEFTAIGEEGFFRGFINNEASARWGNGWGLAGSSLLFGIAHTGQGQTANALQATLAGAYLGWIQQRNGFEIGEGVALHYWINVLAGIAAIRHGGSAPLLSLSVPF